MQIHTYVVQHDKGFAPNPFWGVCTLACCKPRIRRKAEVGDLIIGFGSAARNVGLGGRVIYWMRVSDIISFDDYWRAPAYRKKRAEIGGSLAACYGDNIYHREPMTGAWSQAYSFHSDGEGLGRGNLETDTGLTDRVLIGADYAYWGSAAPAFPAEMRHLIPEFRAERCRYSEAEKAQIVAWIESQIERGYRGAPADWRRDHADICLPRRAA